MPQKIKFFYEKLPLIDQDERGKEIARPVVQILLNYKHGKMFGPLRALIDSGADYNLFPAQVGQLLGINIKKGQINATEGIGGKVITTYRHFGIKMFLEGYSFETFIDFSYEDVIPLLGQQGFFDKLKKITFDRVNEEFYVDI